MNGRIAPLVASGHIPLMVVVLLQLPWSRAEGNSHDEKFCIAFDSVVEFVGSALGREIAKVMVMSAGVSSQT